MLAFVRRNQILLSSCFCLLLSLYLLTAGARGQMKYDPIGPALLWLLRPLQVAAYAVTGWFKELGQSSLALTSLKNDNERLRKRLAELEAERSKLWEIEAANKRLQKLLDFRVKFPSGSITAAIIANSASTWFQSCLINKGSADNVHKGMAVVTPLGLVGQIVSVTAHTAKVLLITDANSGVDVLVQRTRGRGIVSGSLEGATVIKYVKRTEEIQEGDRLITSGVDGIFPKSIFVGTVGKVRKQQAGLFQHVEVIPAVRASQTEEVLVVGADPAPAKTP
jgi:rod shape-determining protein MreC